MVLKPITSIRNMLTIATTISKIIQLGSIKYNNRNEIISTKKLVPIAAIIVSQVRIREMRVLDHSFSSQSLISGISLKLSFRCFDISFT